MPVQFSHTSARVRDAAIKAIGETKRPMTAHEIERWIEDHDDSLSNEIKRKCYDYTRMILSLSPPSIITKYQPGIVLPGADMRAAFYGLARERYPENWIPTMKTPTSAQFPASKPPPPARTRTAAQRAPKSSIFVPTPPAPIVVTAVDNRPEPWPTCVPVWDRPSIFWVSPTDALDSGKADLPSGLIPDDAAVLHANTRPQPPMVFSDMMTVLRKEGVPKHDTLWFTDILDNVA
jgi:hypothetical protein